MKNYLNDYINSFFQFKINMMKLILTSITKFDKSIDDPCLGKQSKKKAEQKVKTAFRVGGYLTCFTFLKHFNKVKNFQLGGV